MPILSTKIKSSNQIKSEFANRHQCKLYFVQFSEAAKPNQPEKEFMRRHELPC